MSPYVPERFSADEEAILRRYVSNLDGPVFALVNLPEVVKGVVRTVFTVLQVAPAVVPR